MKHASSCQCDVCSKDPYETELGIRQNAIKLIKFLEIPYEEAYYYEKHISATDLYDILMDEEKLRVLVSKLRNKAFW